MVDTTIFHFNKETGELLGEDIAITDPIDNLPMIPAYATAVIPPVYSINEIPVTNDNGITWEVIADYRNQVWFNPDGSEVTFNSLGESPSIDQVSALTDALILQRSKRDKITYLENSCCTEVISGYLSSTLGTPHTYPTNLLDQQNLIAVCLAATVTLDPLWKCNFWCSDASGEWSRKAHSKEQILALGVEIQLHIAAKQDKLLLLINQVNDPLTDTLQKVSDILW